ncbi:putative alcohol dehydrogenase [Durotheca rogersii]|uniref:putative alcohol dehydrogenase n=1 Tax=Durotheca rogersii TaxID=419775 RepID=UPI00222123C3|nr:putative alcohol dehydrogenase [Durotheca rogersii]KAI5865335.1 putative alcohol dehydrogenase [Durotheca rogersii]
MAIQETQTAVIQSGDRSTALLPLKASTVPVPILPSEHHVLVRVLAVALNPTDHKMVRHFPNPGNMVGCDFCGVVERSVPGSEAATTFPIGTRVCGGAFPYSPASPINGAFAEWIAADARLLLRVPDTMDDLQGAALGGVGWGTAGLAFFDPGALNLPGRPSNPAPGTEPVLVYGGTTASGTMACQVLKLCGYRPIAVTSTKSAPMAIEYGAIGTAAYTSAKCAEEIKALAGGKPIRYAMDCITTAESAATCFAAMARTGGRYACLEGLPQAARTRPSIRIKEVMGFEGLGFDVNLGDSSYSRVANPELFKVTAQWTAEMQKLVDAAKLKTHPIREVPGRWDGIIQGLALLESGDVRGKKLVVRIVTR